MPIQRHLDKELLTLRRLLLDMSDLVDEQIADALNAVGQCDVELAEAVRQRDDEVDEFELKVDHQCERILALHTPVAVDLRLLITAVKINTDLERIGDHAKNLAKHAKHLVDCSELIKRTQIQEMADMARQILHDAQDAFVNHDRVLARQVLARDRQVDRIYRQTVHTIVELCREMPENADALVHLVTMSKAVERIADHAENIAESVVFLIEGVDIRHRDVQPISEDSFGEQQ